MEGGDTLSGYGGAAAAAHGVDTKVLHAFQTSFVQVQGLLDQNRVLINEINQNHESKVPGDLSRNVGLIRELNNNIRRVVDLYADLSSLFAASSGGGGGGRAASEGGSVGTVRQAGHKRIRLATIAAFLALCLYPKPFLLQHHFLQKNLLRLGIQHWMIAFFSCP